MASVYDYSNYRKLVRDFAKARKESRKGFTLHRLAEAAQMAPPYLTSVLKERAHFSQDQLYAAGKALGFGDDEMQYVQLLLEWERSAFSERKEKLRAQIERIRKLKLKSEAHIGATRVEAAESEVVRYYMNPELQLIHSFLGVAKFAKNVELIAKSLNMDVATVESLVKELKDLGYVVEGKKGLEKTKRRIHLPKESPLCKPQQLLMRYRALQHQQVLPESEKYNFAVLFTADEATRERIQREFLKFLSSIESWVKEAPSESVYQMHFDLFGWSR